MEEQKKKLTDEERQAIQEKYERRIHDLGRHYFGPEWFPEPGQEASIPDPSAHAQALRRRILDASIQLLEAAPPPDRGEPPHRKPGDLERTAERLRNHEVDLPEGYDREEEAAAFEQYAEFARTKIDFGHTMDSVAIDALLGLVPILETFKKFGIDLTHIFKEWALEDPDGPAPAHYEEFNRALKKGAGRPRRR